MFTLTLQTVDMLTVRNCYNLYSNQSAIIYHHNTDRHAELHLKAAGMYDLVADGALHQREAELLFLRLHCVLLSCLTTRKTHRCVRKDGL